MESPTSTHTSMIIVQARFLTLNTCDDARVQAMRAYHAENKEKLSNKFAGAKGGVSASFLARRLKHQQALKRAEQEALRRAEKRQERN